FRIGEYNVREASLHSPRNQPALATFAQILIVRYPDAKFKEPLIEGWRAHINPVFGPHLCKPVSRLARNVKTIDTDPPANARNWGIERRILAGRSIDNPASCGKVGTNRTVLIPGWIPAPAPPLVPTKNRAGNEWRNGVVAQHVPPKTSRRRDFTR